MAAHQAPPSLGFSRQERWSGLPFPSPMHESEKRKWSHSVVSDSLWPHGLQPTRLLCPWDFPGKSTGVGCHCLHYKTLFSWKVLHIRQIFWQPHLLSLCVFLSVLPLASIYWQAVISVSKQLFWCWASSQQASWRLGAKQNSLLHSWIIN